MNGRWVAVQRFPFSALVVVLLLFCNLQIFYMIQKFSDLDGQRQEITPCKQPPISPKAPPSLHPSAADFSSSHLFMPDQRLKFIDARDPNKYSIVINTFRRVITLRHVLAHLNNKTGLPNLAEVVIAWMDQDTSPPQDLVDMSKDFQVPLRIRFHESSSLNERYRPDPLLKTQCILNLDDDLVIDYADIELAFRAWRVAGQERGIVGWVARAYKLTLKKGVPTYKYFIGALPEGYSMILTSSAFSHSMHFDWYWEPATEPMRAMVDEFINCEDILLNFVVYNRTRAPQIKLELIHSMKNYGNTGGISKQTGHEIERTSCVKFFVEQFGFELGKNEFSLSLHTMNKVVPQTPVTP